MTAALATYARTLRTPHVRPLVTASLVARTPIAVVALSLVLFLRERTGSYATAGALAAVLAIASGVAVPLQGRLVDRIGQTRVLLPLVLVHATAIAGIVAAGLADAPVALTGVLCAIAGAAFPPISPCLRSLWGDLIDDDELLTAAYALDAVVIELVFITGPMLTALFVALWSPAAALLIGAGLVLVGGLWFVSLSPSREWRPPGGRRHGVLGALAAPGMRTLAAGFLPIGVCFGTLELVLPAIATEHGRPSLAGVLYALQGVGSAAGGLWYGAAAGRLGGPVRGYLVLLVALPASFALLVLPQALGLLAVAVVVTGLAVAPLTVAANQLAREAAPPGTGTESFTWMTMTMVLGLAVGNALAGTIVDAVGWRAALLAACAVALGAAALAFARRSTLAPAYAPGGGGG